MKISIKFSLLSLFLVLLCGILLFVLVNKETKVLLEEEIRFKLERESKYAIANTDRFIYERLNDIRNLAQDAILTTDTASSKQVLQRLRNFKKQNKLYVSVSFFNTERIRIADTEEKSIGKQHNFTNYWLQSEKEDAVLDISYSESLQNIVMHFAAVVRNQDGKKIGLVVSRVLIHNLYEVFSEVIEGEKMPNMSIALIDTNGVLLYSNRKEDSILVDKHPDIQVITKYSQLAQQQNQTIEEDGEVVTSHYFVHNKQIFLYQKQQGYLNYAGHQWLFVMKIPKATAFASAEILRQKIYYTFIPVLFLSLFLAILFGRYISKPIVQLSRAANAWGNGHLDTTFALNSHKNDEIGVLASQMLGMAKQLAKKMKEQEELNDELQSTNDVLQDVNIDLERKNQNITSSIHYAERIQSAMLPDKDIIRSIFPDFFIVFKPKHIVSGDFYWFQETETQIPVRGNNEIFDTSNFAKNSYRLQNAENSLQEVVQEFVQEVDLTETVFVEYIALKIYLFAVVDCTGHGVPGALMSMIGNNLLYQIVKHEKITSPEKVLTKLHAGVQKVLKQELNNNKDGMDVAICAINPTLKTVEFAGVHRPLIVFSGDKMTEIKGNKVSIGGSFMPEKWHVDKHVIEYQKGDRIYLYTDGFSDQFSDAESPKKYTGKRLKATLEEIQEFDIETQGNMILQEHRDWKGTAPQTDDILVVGLQLK